MHIMKVKLAGGAYNRLADHMERKHNFYKSDVDVTKSSDNIILKPYINDLEGFIKAQGVTRVRKDSVGALNVVCHVSDADKDNLKDNPGEYERWGWAVVNSTIKTLGLTKDDLVGAVIHLDEDKSGNVRGGNAHIQFTLVPLVREKDKTILSAKRIMTKQNLLVLHDRLQAKMDRAGFKGLYVNPNAEARGLAKNTIVEYKKAQDLNKKLLEEKAKLEDEISLIRDDMVGLDMQKIQLEADVKSLAKDKKRLKSLEEFCSNIKMTSGKTALQRFEELEQSKNQQLGR
ncbi:MAG: plasmid recombination protein [Clostridium sp.]|nr:plasmid recombination protein [Clostridium sp.]